MKPFDFDTKGLKERKLISSVRIQRRIRELAGQMARSYRGKPLVVLGLMNGALFFLVDLLRKVPADWEVECWRVQSYQGFHSGGKLKGLAACSGNFKGKHVLVVDDILDTGQTLAQVVAHVRKLGAKSVGVCVLLNKKKKRKRSVQARWVGFPISDEFVVGYGLDLDGRFRALRDIWVIEEVSKD